MSRRPGRPGRSAFEDSKDMFSDDDKSSPARTAKKARRDCGSKVDQKERPMVERLQLLGQPDIVRYQRDSQSGVAERNGLGYRPREHGQCSSSKAHAKATRAKRGKLDNMPAVHFVSRSGKVMKKLPAHYGFLPKSDAELRGEYADRRGEAETLRQEFLPKDLQSTDYADQVLGPNAVGFNTSLADTKWITTTLIGKVDEVLGTVTLKEEKCEVTTPKAECRTPVRKTITTASPFSPPPMQVSARPTPAFLDDKPSPQELLNATMKWEAKVPMASVRQPEKLVRRKGRNTDTSCTSLTDHTALHHHHAVQVRNDHIPSRLPHLSYTYCPPATIPHCPAPQAVTTAQCGNCGQRCCCGEFRRASLPPPPPPPSTWSSAAALSQDGDFLLLVDDSCKIAGCGEDKKE